jgi:hypothetical protein
MQHALPHEKHACAAATSIGHQQQHYQQKAKYLIRTGWQEVGWVR